MFCKNCGARLNTGSRFCPHCGRAQAVTPPAAPGTFADKVRATGKKVGASPAFLIATIFFTVTLALHLISLLPANNTADYESLLADSGIAVTQLDAIALAVGIISMLPTLLTTIGLWITYGSCVSRKPKVNTAGLAIIVIVNLVSMILSCLVLLASLLPCFFVYGRTQDAFAQALALGVGLVIFAVFIFMLIYYIKLCTTITNIRNTMKTGVPNKKASRFVAIMCYIFGGIFIVSGLGSLLSIGTIYLDSYYDETLSYLSPSALLLSAGASLLTAAVQIIFGALIFSYRSKMAALEAEARLNTFQTLSYAEPYTSPVYIPPQPVAEPVPEAVEEAAAPEETAEPTTPEDENT